MSDVLNRNNFPRATSPETRAELGDPERWGGTVVISQFLPKLSNRYTKTGPQILRVQTPALIARGWQLTCQVTVEGADTTGADKSRYLLNVTQGAGQTTSVAPLDLIGIARAYPAYVEIVNAGGVTISLVAQLLSPIPASSLNIVPVLVTQTDGTADDHTIVATFTAFVAPWSLA